MSAGPVIVKQSAFPDQPLDRQRGSDDHVYLEISITSPFNEDGSYSPVKYAATKTEAIIDKPSDYHLFIDRFSVSGFDFPVSIFNPASPGTVTLEYNGDVVSVDLVFVRRGPPVPITEPEYYFVYSINHYQEMLNTAFAAAFAALAAPPAAALAPKMVFDSAAQRFKLYSTPEYDSTLVTPINIYFNPTLQYRYPFFDQSAAPAVLGLEVNSARIYIQDTLTNTQLISGINYLVTTDEASSSAYWSPIQNIIFTTNTIPVSNTFTDYQSDDRGAANSQPILVSFKLPVENYHAQNQNILFIPQTSINQIDLSTEIPLKKLDIELLWQDYLGRTYPLRTPGGFVSDIKLLFVRKYSSTL